ncbi:hypothetical protein AWENTII_003470 [Aspergillus wentii]|nr:hypothetical protein MW887_011875 [Aspergillus wentii]
MLLNPQQLTAEYLFFPAQLRTKPGRTTMHDLLEKKAVGNYISILAMLSHSFSLGSIHIKSSNIQEKPAFNPDYLSHPLDLELLARHPQFIDRLVHTQPFQSFIQPESRIPAVDKADLAELDDARHVVQERRFTCFYPAGSCFMMPVESGVVDSQLKVHGVSNVRTVDACIFPLEPSGNIQATVYAVAERAADMIRV